MSHRLAPALPAPFLLVLLTATMAPAGAQSALPPPTVTYLATWRVAVEPNALAASSEDGTLAVIDAGNSAIEILRPGGSHKTLREGFRDPRCAVFLPGGVLLVGEAGTGSVRGYDAHGRIVVTLGGRPGEFQTPNGIAVHPITGRIYVVDSATDAVKVYQADGTFAFRFGSTGTGPGELLFPVSIAVSGTLDEVFVGDSRNRRIAVFDAETGLFRRNIGRAGSGDGELSFVGGLHLDAQQRLYAVESLGGFVEIFTPEGAFMGQIGEHGKGPGQLRSPKAVTIDRYNRLLVTSFLDGKIEVWGLDEYQNPVDQDLQVVADAIPAHLNPELPSFRVVLQVPGVHPEEIDPDQLRINDSVAPLPESVRRGTHLWVRFPTSEALATYATGTLGDVILRLTGSTRDGVRFAGEIPAVIVPAPAEPGTEAGDGS